MSEFGRGYATCLRQFLNHRYRLAETIVMYARMRERDPKPPPELFTDVEAATLWMNGASDHLYELIKPRRGVGNATWKKAKSIQDAALTIGHGFVVKAGPPACEALLDQADQLLWLTQTETLDEALAWDRDHGLEPDTGSWSCPADLMGKFIE